MSLICDNFKLSSVDCLRDFPELYNDFLDGICQSFKDIGQVVDTYGDLPLDGEAGCVCGEEGSVAYVIDENALFICDGDGWIRVAGDGNFRLLDTSQSIDCSGATIPAVPNNWDSCVESDTVFQFTHLNSDGITQQQYILPLDITDSDFTIVREDPIGEGIVTFYHTTSLNDQTLTNRRSVNIKQVVQDAINPVVGIIYDPGQAPDNRLVVTRQDGSTFTVDVNHSSVTPANQQPDEGNIGNLMPSRTIATHLDGDDNEAIIRETVTRMEYDNIDRLTYVNENGIDTTVRIGPPPGSMMPYGGVTAPAGWLLCNGVSYDRDQYEDLFDAIGTAYGASDGSSFNVPDTRGRFLRSVDGGLGRDPDAGSRTASAAGGNTGDSVGSLQDDEYISHNHPASSDPAGQHNHPNSTSDQRGNHDHSGSETSGTGEHDHTVPQHAYENNDGMFECKDTTSGCNADHLHKNIIISGGAHSHGLTITDDGNHTHDLNITNEPDHTHPITVDNTGGAETRPVNLSVNYIIKY